MSLDQRIRSRTWLAVCIIGVVLLFVLGAQPIAVGIFPPPWDKLAHAIAFGTLFLVLERALNFPMWLVGGIPLLISAADEIHQIWLPGRSADLLDWLAGLLGVIAAMGIRHALNKRKHASFGITATLKNP